jgi:tetratricopeptide (TPR) repeat protein
MELNPEHARAYHLRGLVNHSLGKDDEAIKDFDRAIELNPEYGAGYLSRAKLHAALGNDERAREDMEMVRHFGEKNVQEFADDHNILRSAYPGTEAEKGVEANEG